MKRLKYLPQIDDNQSSLVKPIGFDATENRVEMEDLYQIPSIHFDIDPNNEQDQTTVIHVEETLTTLRLSSIGFGRAHFARKDFATKFQELPTEEKLAFLEKAPKIIREKSKEVHIFQEPVYPKGKDFENPKNEPIESFFNNILDWDLYEQFDAYGGIFYDIERFSKSRLAYWEIYKNLLTNIEFLNIMKKCEYTWRISMKCYLSLENKEEWLLLEVDEKRRITKFIRKDFGCVREFFGDWIKTRNVDEFYGDGMFSVRNRSAKSVQVLGENIQEIDQLHYLHIEPVDIYILTGALEKIKDRVEKCIRVQIRNFVSESMATGVTVTQLALNANFSPNANLIDGLEDTVTWMQKANPGSNVNFKQSERNNSRIVLLSEDSTILPDQFTESEEVGEPAESSSLDESVEKNILSEYFQLLQTRNSSQCHDKQTIVLPSDKNTLFLNDNTDIVTPSAQNLVNNQSTVLSSSQSVPFPNNDTTTVVPTFQNVPILINSQSTELESHLFQLRNPPQPICHCSPKCPIVGKLPKFESHEKIADGLQLPYYQCTVQTSIEHLEAYLDLIEKLSQAFIHEQIHFRPYELRKEKRKALVIKKEPSKEANNYFNFLAFNKDQKNPLILLDHPINYHISGTIPCFDLRWNLHLVQAFEVLRYFQSLKSHERKFVAIDCLLNAWETNF